MLRSFKEALLGFTRSKTMTAFAIVATSFSLLVLGFFALALLNLNTLIRYLEDKVEIVVYLRDSADAALVGLAIEDLSRLEGVNQVRYMSKEEALERFRADLGPNSDLLQDLETNPVPASLNITMKVGYRDTLHVKDVAEAAGQLSFVEEVDYGREWLRRMEILKHVISVVGAVSGTILALVAIILISSAIKIAIFSRRKEIFIMKIVGATNGSIRSSFLVEGFLKGLIGGTIAAGVIYGVTEIFSKKVAPITSFTDKYYACTMLAGAVMGLVGSWISLGRYLRRV
ncbi:MAG TPA: permease-like cell division protein FtsX [archaeon]|nr:permease-like cell division protein FtsX [archaeon]